MKTTALRFLRSATPLLVAGVFGAQTATAADDPTPPATPDRRAPARAARAALQQERVLAGAAGINLDDRQRELLRDVSRQDAEEIRRLEEKLRAAQKELMQAVLAENFQESVVREKAEAVGKIQSDITVLRARAFSTLAPTLRPEQREALENSPLGRAILMGGSPGIGGPGGFGGGFGGAGGAEGFGGGGFGPGAGGAGFGPGGGGGGPRARDGQPGQPGQERPRRLQPPPARPEQ